MIFAALAQQYLKEMEKAWEQKWNPEQAQERLERPIEGMKQAQAFLFGKL